jgi:hypothetical protein
MAINLLDITANNNDLTNSGADEITTSLPFAQSTIAVGTVRASSDYLYAGDSASLSLTGDFTLEGWVKFTSLPGQDEYYVFLSKYSRAGDQGGFMLMFENTNFGAGYAQNILVNTMQTQDTTTRDIVYLSWTPEIDTWYHIAVTCDISQATATTFEYFIDGVSQGNGTAFTSGNCASIWDNALNFQIGAGFDGTNPERFFNGVIDDVRVWSDIRTPTEIANNKSVELVGNETNLEAYWPFESTLGGSGSASASQSLSFSASMSFSASQSPSASGSASGSKSGSKSASASPSTGYAGYTKGNYAVLPADDTDLENAYSAQNVTDVETDDGVRVGQTATLEYMVHQYKNFVSDETSCNLNWNGQSSLAPSASAVVLQIYNRDTTTWDTVDSDNTTGADTDFDLSGTIADLTNYRDTSNVITCRIYQLAT